MTGSPDFRQRSSVCPEIQCLLLESDCCTANCKIWKESRILECLWLSATASRSLSLDHSQGLANCCTSLTRTGILLSKPGIIICWGQWAGALFLMLSALNLIQHFLSNMQSGEEALPPNAIIEDIMWKSQCFFGQRFLMSSYNLQKFNLDWQEISSKQSLCLSWTVGKHTPKGATCICLYPPQQ